MTRHLKSAMAKITIFALMLQVCQVENSAKATEPSYGLSNPRVVSINETNSYGELQTVKSTWDCIWFGNYWQEDTNGDRIVNESDDKQPIKWRILSVDGDDAFLLSDKYILCKL